MGTVLEVTLHGDGAPEVLEEVFAVAAQLDERMSVYHPESDISRLNRAAGQGPQPVDRQVRKILERSVAYSHLTRGSFDVTVGPLVALWQQGAERGTPPTDAEIDEARGHVGVEHLVFYDEGTVELADPSSRLNLGGIAKGYALDRMRRVLRKRGIRSALLNFGQSSTWAVGVPPDGPGWRLLVRGPEETFIGVIRLSNQALSVSGSLGQWVEIGGQRFGHVIDPRTGRPLQRRRQALVVAPDATEAEALSKALLILGEEEGIALVAAQHRSEGMLVDADGGQWATPGWIQATGFEPLPQPQAADSSPLPVPPMCRPCAVRTTSAARSARRTSR
jgi:thiamine biosynthesis lipoprotein